MKEHRASKYQKYRRRNCVEKRKSPKSETTATTTSDEASVRNETNNEDRDAGKSTKEILRESFKNLLKDKSVKEENSTKEKVISQEMDRSAYDMSTDSMSIPTVIRVIKMLRDHKNRPEKEDRSS